jgi:hypothetical protein
MGRRTWTEQQFVNAVTTSVSVREVIRKLDLNYTGGNFSSIKRNIAKRNLDTSHFLGQAATRGITHTRQQKPLSLLLVEHGMTNRSSLKKRLIKEGILQERCAICDLPPKWNNHPITLELDHINGVYDDHRLENLRLLCPNCHSQMPTTHGKNNRRPPTLCLNCGIEVHNKSKRCMLCAAKARTQNKQEEYRCIDCLSSIVAKRTRCKACAGRFRETTKIIWPSKQDLLNKLSTSNYCAVGRELGVSDNAIRKHIKKNP